MMVKGANVGILLGDAQKKYDHEQHKTFDKVTPVITPFEIPQGYDGVLVDVDAFATKGSAGGTRTGYIEEGEPFDPQKIMNTFPPEWYLDGRGQSPYHGTGKVKVPLGSLCYSERHTGGGYGYLTLWRAGTSIVHEERIPNNSDIRKYLQYFPKGSYIALPGESGIEHPDYVPPFRYETRSDSSKGDGDTLRVLTHGMQKGVLEGSYDEYTAWSGLFGSNVAKFVKEGSRRGHRYGQLIVETQDPDSIYALTREKIGDEWKITTLRDALTNRPGDVKEILWEEFEKMYSGNHGESPPKLPELEEVLKPPESPFGSNGSIAAVVYRRPNGELLSKPLYHGYNIVPKRGVKACAPDISGVLNDFVRSANGGKVNVDVNWSHVSSEKKKIVVNDGYDDLTFDVGDIPESPGLYAVWYDRGSTTSSKNEELPSEVLPTSFAIWESDDGPKTAYVALTEYEAYDYYRKSNFPSYTKGKSAQFWVDYQNRNIKAARGLLLEEAGSGSNWSPFEGNDQEELQQEKEPSYIIGTTDPIEYAQFWNKVGEYRQNVSAAEMLLDYGELHKGGFKKYKNDVERFWQMSVKDPGTGGTIKYRVVGDRLPTSKEMNYYFQIDPTKKRRKFKSGTILYYVTLEEPFPEDNPLLEIRE